MKTLVSPQEVTTILFGSVHTLEERAIPLCSILSAEQSFLLPAVGKELYDVLRASTPDSRNAGFVEEYLKQPLALYVASRLLPTIAVKVGSAGVVRLAGESFEAVDEVALHKVVVRMRAEADTLLARATYYLASHPDEFPDYAPAQRTHHIVGGVVM